MSNESDGPDEGVTVSMELAGEYGEVMDKLDASTGRMDVLDAVTADLETLLETLVAIDGGTKSVVAERLPEDTNAAHDAESVVTALQVLERYDLVELEGNTWNPGPALSR